MTITIIITFHKWEIKKVRNQQLKITWKYSQYVHWYTQMT